MAAGVGGYLLPVGELDQWCVPKLDFDVRCAKHVGNDFSGLFGIERRSRVPIRHELWIIRPATCARSKEPAAPKDTLRFGKCIPRFIEVVQHPQHRDRVDAAVADR